LTGIARDCEVNAGGIKRVLIASYADVLSVTVTDDVISAVTLDTGKYFAEYYVRKGVASYTGTPQFNDDGDYTGEDGVLSLVFGRMSTAKRKEVDALSKQDLAVVFQDANGLWWYLGKDYPVTRNGGDTTTGTAQTDRNGYGIDLHSSDNGAPFEVDEDVIETLLPA
jgi:hypothetical protein